MAINLQRNLSYLLGFIGFFSPFVFSAQAGAAQTPRPVTWTDIQTSCKKPTSVTWYSPNELPFHRTKSCEETFQKLLDHLLLPEQKCTMMIASSTSKEMILNCEQGIPEVLKNIYLSPKNKVNYLPQIVQACNKVLDSSESRISFLDKKSGRNACKNAVSNAIRYNWKPFVDHVCNLAYKEDPSVDLHCTNGFPQGITSAFLHAKPVQEFQNRLFLACTIPSFWVEMPLPEGTSSQPLNPGSATRSQFAEPESQLAKNQQQLDYLQRLLRDAATRNQTSIASESAGQVPSKKMVKLEFVSKNPESTSCQELILQALSGNWKPFVDHQCYPLRSFTGNESALHVECLDGMPETVTPLIELPSRSAQKNP